MEGLGYDPASVKKRVRLLLLVDLSWLLKFPWIGFIAQHSKLIFDTRNATKGIRDKHANIQLL